MFSKGIKKGFTLIELLIVITIIGILAVAFLPSLLGAPSKARDTQRVADLQKLSGVFTTMTITGSLPGTSCIGSDGTVDGVAGVLKAPDFGGKIPVDPSGASNVLDQGVEGKKKDNKDPSGKLQCSGTYLFVRNPGDPYGSYAFGVYAQLENATGNISCDRVGGSTIVVTGGKEAKCHAILVQ